MGWNTLFRSVCIWSCSEESQVRVSLNFDQEIRFGFLGLLFFFDKRLGVFIMNLSKCLMKMSLSNAPYGILKNKLYTCQFLISF